MNYNIGDQIKVVSSSGRSGIHQNDLWIGRVGKINKFDYKKIYIEFDPALEENQILKKFYMSPIPIPVYFGEEELEPYIQDINFLD